MATIASLVAHLEMNTVRFEQGLTNATSVAETAMKRIEGAAGLAKLALGGLAGALSIGGIIGFVKSTIEATASLKDMAENTNATVEQMSALAKIAKRSGQDMEPVVAGLQKLERQMVAAASGSKEAQQNFATFGISAQEVKAKLNDPAAMMLLLAQRADEFNRSAIKTDAMMALMGKGGANLGKYMGELAQQTELVGNRTTEQADRAEKFELALRRLSEGVDKVAKGLVIDMLPALEKLIPLMKVAAELAALWFGAFVVGPKIIAAVTAAWAVLIGLVQTSVLYFGAATTALEAMNASLYGTSILAMTTGSALATLTVIASGLFAAFAGLKIGEYLVENFAVAKQAGILLVQNLMEAWEHLKFGFRAAVEGMQTLWGGFIESIGKGLAKIPGMEGSGNILQSLGQAQKGTTMAALAAERDAAIAADKAIFVDMLAETMDGLGKVSLAAGKARHDLSMPPNTEGLAKYNQELAALVNRLENNGEGVSAKFWKELDMLNKAFASKDPERYAKLVAELIKTTDYGKAAFQKLTEAARAHNAAMDEAFNAEEKERLAVENGIKAFREKAESIEFETSLIGLSSAEREKAIVLHELEAKKVTMTAEAYAELSERVQGQIVRIQAANANRAAIEDALTQQVDMWKSIEGVAHQTWNSIADGSKNLWQRVKDSAKNIFFDWLYQMTAKKWLIQAMVGVSGTGAAAQAFGQSAVNAATSGGSSLVGSAVGNMASSAATYAFGSTVSGAGVGSIAAGSTYGTGFLSQQSLMLAAQETTGAASTVLAGAADIAAAIPYIGWVVAAIAVIAAFAGKGGGPKMEGNTNWLTGAEPTRLGHNFADIPGAGFTGSSADAQLQPLGEALAKSVYSTIAMLGGTGAGLKIGLGYNTDPAGTAPDNISGYVGDSAGGFSYLHTYDADRGSYATQLQTETKRVILAAIAASDVDDAYRNVVKSINLMTASAEQLDQAMKNIVALEPIVAATERLAAIAPDLANSIDLLGTRSGEEIAAYSNIIGYALADPVADAAKIIEAQGRSAYDTWIAQGEAMRTMAAGLDGSLGTAQQLATLTQSRYQTELALAQQIASALASTTAMFADTRESIMMSVLDNQGKYARLVEQSAALEDQLLAAIDPAKIEALAKQLNGMTTQAWGLLDDGQKKNAEASYLAWIDRLNTEVTDRLNAVQADLGKDHNAAQSDTVSAAIIAGMNQVLPTWVQAANTALLAAQTPVRIDNHVTVDVNAAPGLEASTRDG